MMYNNVISFTTLRERTVYEAKGTELTTTTMTAEEAIRERLRAMAIAGAQRATDGAPLHEAVLENFNTAIEAAASHLQSAGYPGGRMQKRWRHRGYSDDVAVWYLEVDLHGTYWFSPTHKAVLMSPLDEGEDAERYRFPLHSMDHDHDRRNAIAQRWLINMPLDPYTSDLQALTEALVRLASR